MLIPFGVFSAAGAGGGGAAGSYELISTTVLGSAQASVTFTNAGAWTDYKHLQIRFVGRSTRALTVVGSPGIYFNGTGSGQYSSHVLKGTGSTVAAAAYTSQDFMFSYYSPAANASANLFSAYVVDVLDFASTSKNTTIRSFGGFASGGEIALLSGAWNNTSAVTSITIDHRDAGTWATGSRFSIYGLKG